MHSAFAEDFSEQSALGELTCGLCRSVVNMMIEYARTYAVSALANSVCLRREIKETVTECSVCGIIRDVG